MNERNEANEHFRRGAYTDVRNQRKAQFNEVSAKFRGNDNFIIAYILKISIQYFQILEFTSEIFKTGQAATYGSSLNFS